jgi:hypothetical protein
MKLRKEMVDYLSHRIVASLQEKDLLDCEGEELGVEESISAIIIDDLLVEDDLNQEVKEILEQMGDEMEAVDYRKMFNMVKSKIARERGLIL